jgi:hypothetical protein
MGTLNAIYVRADQQASALKATYPSAYTEPGSSFFAIDLPPDHFDCPEGELLALSKTMETDVLWITFQSAVDAFVYHHWKSGLLQRSLVFGAMEQGIWEQVEGNAEPWEREAFFESRQLRSLLEDMDDAEERQQTQRIYDEQVLEVGNWLPMVDARESARAIAEHYGLPGWQ